MGPILPDFDALNRAESGSPPRWLAAASRCWRANAFTAKLDLVTAGSALSHQRIGFPAAV